MSDYLVVIRAGFFWMPVNVDIFFTAFAHDQTQIRRSNKIQKTLPQSQ